MVNQSLRRQLDGLVTDRWAWRGVRTLLRACWIAVSIWCIGLGGALLWGWPLRLEVLGAASLACIGVALLLLLRPRMRAEEAARRLDQRFGLNEQLASALEVARPDAEPGSVGAYLVRSAVHNARQLRHQIRKTQRPPWGELVTLICLCAAALGLLLMSGIGVPGLTASADPLPPLAAPLDEALPQEPPAPGDGDQIVPGAGGDAMMPQDGAQTGEGGGQQQGAGQGAGDPRTMEAIADALRDQGATRSAAEALDRGDAAGAAQELRELADQAGQLSPSARGTMADSLRDAAQQIDRTDPQTADQLRESASGLEGSPEDASQALEDLARAVDRMGGQQGQDGQPGQQAQGGAPQSSSGGQPDQSSQQGQSSGGQGQQGQGQDGQGSGAGNTPAGQQRPVQPQRLGVDGRPVELSAEGGGQAGAEGRPSTTVPGGAGATGGGDTTAVGETGADPLRIPLDERDVVQDYFTP